MTVPLTSAVNVDTKYNIELPWLRINKFTEEFLSKFCYIDFYDEDNNLLYSNRDNVREIYKVFFDKPYTIVEGKVRYVSEAYYQYIVSAVINSNFNFDIVKFTFKRTNTSHRFMGYRRVNPKFHLQFVVPNPNSNILFSKENRLNSVWFGY